MGSLYYVLDGQAVRAVDVQTWAAWFEAAREDGRTRIAAHTLPDGRWLSTVFLGIDHAWGGGPPQLFESMVFRSETDLDETYCARHATWRAAMDGHYALLRRLREGLPAEE
jgi:hypothetical protein